MSLEHSPARQQRRAKRQPVARVALTVSEWCQATDISRPTAYRMMQDGTLKYVQIRGMRRIPVEEQRRLGLTSSV